MMVSDLKKLLQNLGILLENQGAKQLTADLDRVATVLVQRELEESPR